MTAGGTMALSPEAALAELHGESVVLHLSTGRYYSVNGTGTSLLKLLKDGATRDALVESLVTTHSIARDAAVADVDRWLALLSRGGLLREKPPEQARPR